MSDSAAALERLVGRLDIATTPAQWVVATCGIPTAELVDLADLLVALSPEAERFLAETSHILRNLVSGTTVDRERCVGQVRGPISWSETIAAWSTGIGTDDVFICVSPRRDYDQAENRVVAWLLHRLSRSPRRLDTAASMRIDEARRQRLRVGAVIAEKSRRHRYLVGVSASRPTPSELRKARTTRHLAVYEPALALAERVVRPFRPSELIELVDRRTADQLVVLDWLGDDLAERGHQPVWEIAASAVRAGDLWYRHATHFGPAERGISLGPVVIDAAPGLSGRERGSLDDLGRVSAALSARAANRPWVVVGDRSDARLAVEMALDADPSRRRRASN